MLMQYKFIWQNEVSYLVQIYMQCKLKWLNGAVFSKTGSLGEVAKVYSQM